VKELGDVSRTVDALPGHCLLGRKGFAGAQDVGDLLDPERGDVPPRQDQRVEDGPVVGSCGKSVFVAELTDICS
jgi:hypothetical protein